MSTTDAGEASLSAELRVEQRIGQTEYPHRDPEILSHLYEDRELTQREIAERLDCAATTISRWMARHGIHARKPDASQTPASFCHNQTAHEHWTASEDGTTTGIYVHELLAIADGADPSEVFSDENVIHHRDGHPFDNRAENVEVVTHRQHSQTHKQAVWQVDDILGCRVLKTATQSKGDES